MIDEALDFLRLGKSHSNGQHRPASRPLITAGEFHEMTKPTEALIRQYPAAALATAFFVGVAVAWWIKRK
jgi:hypothetical protein